MEKIKGTHDLGGELTELIKQVRWAKGDEFADELKKSIMSYGQRVYGWSYDEGHADAEE